MLQVANFLHKWITIDKHAKLAVLQEEFCTQLTISHTYNIQDLPTEPTEIKSTIHAFYTKSGKDDLVLNTTIEIISHNSFWSTIKQAAHIDYYTKAHKIKIQLIGTDMLQKVQIGFLTNTISSLMLNRDDILSDIRRLCDIDASTPLICHDKRYYHHAGVPGSHYTLSPTGLVLFTDKSKIDDAKELIYGKLQQSLWNRRFLPRSTIIVPCSPDDTLPPLIHERIMKAHIHTITTLQQCSIEGLTWKEANTAATLHPGSNFQAHSKLSGIVP
jgi:hypothetical protein